MIQTGVASATRREMFQFMSEIKKRRCRFSLRQAFCFLTVIAVGLAIAGIALRHKENVVTMSSPFRSQPFDLDSHFALPGDGKYSFRIITYELVDRSNNGRRLGND